MADPVSLPTNFLRLGKFPIDETIVVATYQQLTAYAATNPTAYIGQIVSVTALNAAYIIRGDKSVLPLQTGTLSANWENTFNTVNTNSANWISNYNFVNSNSANWASVYTITLNNSSGWENTESIVNLYSNNWNSVYSTNNLNSAKYESVFSNVNSNSAIWNSVYSSFNNNSSSFVDVRTFVNNNSTNINNVNSKVNTTSANWDSVYSNYNSNSGSFATKQYTANNFLALSGGYVLGDVSIGGNLFLLGSATQITTEDLVLSNSLIYLASGNPADIVDIGFVGYTSAIDLGQRYSGLVRDSFTKKWVLFSKLSSVSGNNVNINDATLQVDTLKANIEGNLVGNTLIFGDLSASGKVLGNNLNIQNWDSVYSTNNLNSAKYESVFSRFNANSGRYESNYTTFNSNSAQYGSNYTIFNTNSGKYESVFSNVNSNSANNQSVFSNVNSNSSKYESVFSRFNANSGKYESNHTTFNTNSGKYESVFSNVNSNSANNQSVYTTYNTNSGRYESVFSNVNSNSSKYESVFSNVNSNSANWDSNYTNTLNNSSFWVSNFSTVCSLSDNFNSVFSNVNSNSSNWQETYITVQNNSGTVWNYQGTDLKALSGRWESVYTNSNANSSLDLNARTFVNQNSSNFNSLYSSVCSNSSTYATILFSNSKFIPLSSVDQQLNATSTNTVTNSAVTNRILQIENSLNVLVPAPTYTAPAATLTTFSPTEFEVGQTVTRSLVLGYTQNDGGAATNYRLEKNSTLVQEQSTPFTRNVSEPADLGLTRYTCIVTHLSGAVKQNALGLPDARGVIPAGTKSINRDYNAYYRQFFGSVNSIPATPSLIRNLTGSNYTTTNSFTFYVYTRNTVVAIPSSKQLVSIITGSFENLTTQFNLSATQVPDAGGILRAYKIYSYTTVNPYNSNFTITLS
jgi:hypothetical protein